MSNYKCAVCQEEIEYKEYTYSMRFFKMPLCRKHQEIQKIAQERLAKAEKTNPRETEPKTASNVELKYQKYQFKIQLFQIELKIP